MARLTEAEREALRQLADKDCDAQSLSANERFVAPTPEARARYIRFATEASRFYRGEQPVRFGGDCWRL